MKSWTSGWRRKKIIHLGNSEKSRMIYKTIHHNSPKKDYKFLYFIILPREAQKDILFQLLTEAMKMKMKASGYMDRKRKM